MRALSPCLIMLGILVWPGMVAAINFSGGVWTTSFDYSGGECSMSGAGGGTDCTDTANDGLEWDRNPYTRAGKNTEAVVAANNPNGDGGMGFRTWIADGNDNQTGDVSINFGGTSGPQKEFWLRWYQRYSTGFTWGQGLDAGYDKTFYMYTGGSMSLPFGYSGGEWGVAIQGGASSPDEFRTTGVKWSDLFGGPADGLFHMIEMHIKLDTAAGNDGIFRMWLDGVNVIDLTGVDWTGGDSASQQGITHMEFNSNQNAASNTGGMGYVDYDDIAIYNVTPPNTDSGGRPWIGPLNGYSGAASLPKPKSPAPVGVSFNHSIENNNFASRGWYDNKNEVLANLGGDLR